MNDIKTTIVGYDSAISEHFLKINVEWIADEFYVEDYDLQQLENSQKMLDDGGYIFFAKYGDHIAGTVALLQQKDNSFELAKMGIYKKYRGLKIGDELMKAAIAYSKEKGKEYIWLESNTKSVPAVSIYRKYGFKEIDLDPNTPYDRCNIRMKLPL